MNNDGIIDYEILNESIFSGSALFTSTVLRLLLDTSLRQLPLSYVLTLKPLVSFKQAL